MTVNFKAIPNRTVALLASASILFVAGSAQATTILKASINFFGTNEISSNDPGFSPSQQAVRTQVLDNGLGSGDIGFVAGLGVLKAQGQVISNMESEGFALALVDDIIFRHSDQAACQPSCAPQIPVTVAAQIDGGFTLFPGIAAGRARADASLNVRRAGSLIGQSTFHVDSDPSEDGLGPFVDTLAVSFFVDTGVAYQLDMSLGIAMGALRGFFGAPSGIKVDFANTFSLNPEAVFQVGPDIEVNSATGGIVNNQIVHLLEPGNGGTSVPEPGALALFGIGLFGVSCLRRKGQSDGR